jgi:phage tail-like protein
VRIEDFRAAADLVGRRVRISWTFRPESGETLADVPPVVVRRKVRDFEFPLPAAPDPYLVYDSATFPPTPVPGSVAVSDLPTWEWREGAVLNRATTVSVASNVNGQLLEVMRRTLITTIGPDGHPERQSVELLDVGGVPGNLQPLTTYYYALGSPSLPPDLDPARYRASAAPGEVHALNRKLYELIPEVYRRHDVTARPTTGESGLIPEASGRAGQLRRFVDLFGLSLDAMRSSAEGLLRLHDAAEVDYRFLPFIAQWIGWDLGFDLEISQQRNELASAPRLYDVVGTIPGLRAIVNHYTGWNTRVAEFAQSITRSNQGPELGLFESVQVGSGWESASEAARVLGFASGNDQASGSPGVPASLLGSAVEPFALAPGMTLRVDVDERMAAAVRFARGDFVDIGAATAAEVAAAIGRTLDELSAEASAGSVRLISRLVGNDSSLRVERSSRDVVSLQVAARGRLSATSESSERRRLFFATTEGVERDASRSRIFYKTFSDDSFRDSHVLDLAPPAGQVDPAASLLSGGRTALFWIQGAGAAASVTWAFGASRPRTPARLFGRLREPFALVPGRQMRISVNGAPEQFVVQLADYVDPNQATALEVRDALNAQLTLATASVEADRSLRLSSVDAGPSTRLEIDLFQSNTARAIGFGEVSRADGAWDETLDFDAARSAFVPPGMPSDLSSVTDPADLLRLFFVVHVRGAHRLARTAVGQRSFVATASGVSVREPNASFSSITSAEGLPSNDVRGLGSDADGHLWFATAAGAARRFADGVVETFDVASTGGGLASNNLRAVSVAPDGSIWFAHDAGASARRSDGTWSTLDMASGLPSNDVRHVLVTATDVWIATAAGIVQVPESGSLVIHAAANGLPSPSVRRLAVDPSGALWAATAGGLAELAPGASAWRAFDETSGLADIDVRSLTFAADGTLWAAPASGVSERSKAGLFRSYGAAEGLLDPDTRSVTAAPDGSVWVGTPSGLSIRAPGSSFEMFGTAEGLLDDSVREVQGPLGAIAFDVTGPSAREPRAFIDASNRLWVVWSERQGFGTTEDDWLLRARRYDFVTRSWGPTLPITQLPPGGHARDRESALGNGPAGAVNIYFSSDRGGGPKLWSVEVDGLDGVSAPAPVTSGAAADFAPLALEMPNGRLSLFYRSDENVPLGQVGSSAVSGRSERLPEAASIRRRAGCLSAFLTDLDRNAMRRRFGDLSSYTPEKPALEKPLEPDELYTPGTLGLYVSRPPAGKPLTARDAQRLRQLLERFLPINLRAVIVLAPSVLTEFLYPPGADIEESYLDDYPFADALGPIMDSSQALLPDWLLLLATDGASLTVDPSQPTTLRRRSWWRPPE